MMLQDDTGREMSERDLIQIAAAAEEDLAARRERLMGVVMDGMPGDPEEWGASAVDGLIALARRAEREACVLVLLEDGSHLCDHFAALIRARNPARSTRQDKEKP